MKTQKSQTLDARKHFQVYSIPFCKAAAIHYWVTFQILFSNNCVLSLASPERYTSLFDLQTESLLHIIFQTTTTCPCLKINISIHASSHVMQAVLYTVLYTTVHCTMPV